MNEICPIIYKTINIYNNKSYVGKDLYNVSKYLGSGKLLKLAFKKYGKENFKKEIIEFCKDVNHMNIREIYWIKKLNTFSPNGYNINVGGKGGDTYTYRSEKEKLKFKKKLSEIRKGKKHSEKTKRKMSKKKKGISQKRRENVKCPYCHKVGDKLNFSRWHFNYCKENPNRINREIKKIECPYCHKILNIANAFQWHFDYCKKNPNRIIKPSYSHSEETKQKISNSRKGRKHTKETKEKIRKSIIGKKHSEETKNKHSLRMKEYWKKKI